MKEWFRDQHYVVFWVEDSRGAYPAEEFLEALKLENAKVRSDAANIEVLIRRLASHGILRNNQKFVALRNHAVEFKAHQVRVFGVMKGRVDNLGCLMLTHGVKKKKNKGIPGIVDKIWERLRADPHWTEENS